RRLEHSSSTPAKNERGDAEVPGVKTNEREGTRAVLRHSRMSAYKARQVLDQIRGLDADRALETLALGDREAAGVIGKVLASAVANAVHNDGLSPDELFVSACYADEGSTLKRWRPRARGRATRIRKRTCHVTVIVSRLPEDRIARRRRKQSAAGSQRSRRVAGSRRSRRSEASPAESKEPLTKIEEISSGRDEAEPLELDGDGTDDGRQGAEVESGVVSIEPDIESGADADAGESAESDEEKGN
ncbi:MAG: 50S ribosomal protein L22, partial [Acidimicrobiales bacterium]